MVDATKFQNNEKKSIIRTDGHSFELSRYNCRLSYNIKSGEGQLLFGVFVNEFQLSLWDAVMEVFIGLIHVLSGTGILMHAACVATETGGWLIPGKSGSGKSTIASDFPASSVINDEKILVTFDENMALACDVPLYVPYRGEAYSTRLQGIIFLERLRHNAIQLEKTKPFSAVQIAQNLLFHTLPTGYCFIEQEKGVWLEKLLLVCTRFASMIPGKLLMWEDDLLIKVNNALKNIY